MSDGTKDKEPKAPISFNHLGGQRVGNPVLLKPEKPIDFSSIGGRCVRKANEHSVLDVKPDDSDKKEADARD
jgi:hypothetical protein